MGLDILGSHGTIRPWPTYNEELDLLAKIVIICLMSPMDCCGAWTYPRMWRNCALQGWHLLPLDHLKARCGLPSPPEGATAGVGLGTVPGPAQGG